MFVIACHLSAIPEHQAGRLDLVEWEGRPLSSEVQVSSWRPGKQFNWGSLKWLIILLGWLCNEKLLTLFKRWNFPYRVQILTKVELAGVVTLSSCVQKTAQGKQFIGMNCNS